MTTTSDRKAPNMTTPAARPRQTKTPQQRAQEALAVEDARVTSLTERQERLTALVARKQAELDGVSTDLAAAERRRDFAAQHPDLDGADPQQMSIGDVLDDNKADESASA